MKRHVSCNQIHDYWLVWLTQLFGKPDDSTAFFFLQYTTSVPKTASIYVKVPSCRKMTRFCMFNLHIVTQLETKSNVSNRYILKLWVSKTKKTWSFNENIDESEISVMNNLQRGSIFCWTFHWQRNWKLKRKKKSRILVYPMTDFFLLMKNRNNIWMTKTLS